MKTALVTGASNGIGKELALIHAANGDQVVLVARSEKKLQDLKLQIEQKWKVPVHVIVKDLSQANASEELYAQTKALNLKIDFLINNAGFGNFGFFSQTEWAKEHQMIALNITALTALSKLYLQDMLAQKSGRILNVASTAAFQPGPTFAVYCATKAYVLSFSEALANEGQGTGVTVTALCPGATESGFMEAAAMNESALFTGKRLPDSKSVAEFGYKAMMKGKAVVIHGTLNFLLANTVRFTPRSLVTRITRLVLDRK